MVTYKFKLIDSKVPVIKGENIITDSNVLGTKNTYNIYKLYTGKICKYLQLLGYKGKYIGTKTFLRPYKSIWDKKEKRLPAPYWGKGPLLNMWLVLRKDYKDTKNVKTLWPESDTTHHCVKIFNIDFLSQELNKNLKLNKSFYQSNFKRYETNRKR